MNNKKVKTTIKMLELALKTKEFDKELAEDIFKEATIYLLSQFEDIKEIEQEVNKNQILFGGKKQ